MVYIILLVIGIAVFIVLSCLIIVITNVLFEVFAASIFFFAAIVLVFGVIFGFAVALINTVKVYAGLFKSRQGGK